MPSEDGIFCYLVILSYQKNWCRLSLGSLGRVSPVANATCFCQTRLFCCVGSILCQMH
jgi:hypothetical protein